MKKKIEIFKKPTEDDTMFILNLFIDGKFIDSKAFYSTTENDEEAAKNALLKRADLEIYPRKEEVIYSNEIDLEDVAR